jgi:hypothetical protein
MINKTLISLALVLLAGGCPASEDEERRAATLAFLDAEPSPSSIRVIQPDAAGKLAEVEPQVTDSLRRDRLVRALVLDDTDEARAVLLDIIGREPERIPLAFDTASRFGLVTRNLDLLYPRLDDALRCDVFVEVCWPSFDGEPNEVRNACSRLWAAEPATLHSGWLRRLTHAGPSDDPAPYELLREGLDEERAVELDTLILRIAGGDVIPAESADREGFRLAGVLAERRSRLAGGGGSALNVAFEGGAVQLKPPASDDEAGRLGRQLGNDLAGGCVASWGAAVRSGSLALEVRLQGAKAPPTVDSGAESGPGAELASCLALALAERHAAGAGWAPRAGLTRITLTARRESAGWDGGDEGRLPLAESQLRVLADALARSGGGDWPGRLGGIHDEAPLLRDLGATDLGFCLRYVANDWNDCARWLGRMSAEDGELDEVLRAALGDPDPGIRGLARVALAERLDDEAIDEAVPAGDDDSAAPASGGGAV